LTRRHDLKNARAQEVASELFIRLINYAREVARGKTAPGPFAQIAGLNVVRKALSDAQSTRTHAATPAAHTETAPKPKNTSPHNQTRREQSKIRYKTTPD
ncbi:MAG TPA: hypothetical protein VLS25_10600, partial [Dehalococcoidia bacterium]|nr:hypothetical protein [Dehalococcoidia bacterium]